MKVTGWIGKDRYINIVAGKCEIYGDGINLPFVETRRGKKAEWEKES